MKKKLISLGITLFLILTIIFVYLINISNIYLGPYFKTYSSQNRIYQKAIQQFHLSESTLLNFYRLNEVVFITEANVNGKELYLWFDEEASLLTNREVSSFNEIAVKQVAMQIKMEDAKISFGWYKEAPMIVLNNAEKEVLLDYDSLSVMLIYLKKGIS